MTEATPDPAKLPTQHRTVTTTLLILLAFGYGPQDLDLRACLAPSAQTPVVATQE